MSKSRSAQREDNGTSLETANMLKQYGTEEVSREEELDLFNIYRNGSKEESEKAKEKIISTNLWVVRYIATRMYKKSKRHLPLDDLMQEGVIGLIDSMDDYDVSMGYRFNTFAGYRIYHSIQCILFDDNEIRVPRRKTENYNKQKRWEEEYFSRNGEYPTESETDNYCKMLGIDADEFSYVENINSVYSLDDTIKDVENDDIKYEDLMETNDRTDEEAINSVLSDELHRYMQENLKYREEKVIESRFELFGEPKMTYEELSSVFGVSKQRVQQIEKRGMEKLMESKKFAKLFRDYV